MDERGRPVDPYLALVHRLRKALLSNHEPVQIDWMGAHEEILVEP